MANTIRARNANAAGSERDLAIEASSARSPSVKLMVVVRVYALGMRHLQGCLTPCTFYAYELTGQDTRLLALRPTRALAGAGAGKHQAGPPCM